MSVIDIRKQRDPIDDYIGISLIALAWFAICLACLCFI